jgi:hypothetical protein
MQKQSFLAFVILAIFSLAGCGDGQDTVSVTGNVTYQGNPVKSGAMSFFPTTGRPAYATISAGTYDVELPPGDYVVTISAGSAEKPANYKEGDPLPPDEFTLPPEVTTRSKSKLTAKVTTDQSEPIDFKL